MTGGRSLRVRAIAAALLWIALALGAGGVTILKLFQDSMDRQHDARLEGQLDLLTSSIALGESRPEARMTEPAFARVFSGMYWQAERDAGERRVSRSLWDHRLDAPAAGDGIMAVHVDGPDGQHLRLLSRRLLTGDDVWHLAVAADIAPLDAERARFRQNLLIYGALLAIALLASAALLLHSALLPLHRLRRAVVERHSGEADGFTGNYPSEVQPLVDDLDTMLQRNAQLRERGRVRAANLAHALKTPAAILRNELDKAKRGEAIDLDIAEQAVERIAGAAERQAVPLPAAPPILAVTPVDAVPVLRETVGALRRLFPHVDFQIDAPDRFPLSLDIDEQHEIFGNLLDNAGKWARRTVRIGLDATNGSQITVEDDGPGVPEGERDRVIIQGVRLDESRSGSGLGLAIVAEIVENHGGTLHLESARLGGLRVRLDGLRTRNLNAG